MESESHGDLLARLVAESRSFESSTGMPKGTVAGGVHPPPWRASPSEYGIREIPEDLYLEVLALPASKRELLAQRPKSPPKAGVISRINQSDRNRQVQPFGRHCLRQ